MNREPLRSIGRAAGWACIIGTGFMTAFISLVAVTSVWEGFRNIPRDGAWVPIVAGTLLFGVVLWLYIRVAVALYRRLHREESLDL